MSFFVLLSGWFNGPQTRPQHYFWLSGKGSGLSAAALDRCVQTICLACCPESIGVEELRGSPIGHKRLSYTIRADLAVSPLSAKELFQLILDCFW